MTFAEATVLAVDDNATIRRAIAMRLGAKGLNVVTAVDGLQALKMVEQQEFDVVLLDLQMPGMRGDEVLKRLRSRYSELQLPVIMLAASDDKNDINRTLELGANDYVTKPGDLPILLARIRTQLSLKAAAHRLSGLAQTPNVESAANGDSSVLHTRRGGELRNFARDNRYRLLYDNMPMTCFTLSKEGEILLANRFGTQYLGYLPADLMHKSIIDFYAAEDQCQVQEYLASVVEQPDRVHRWEVRRRKKNGDFLWMRETVTAVKTDDVRLILMTCEDIDDTYKLSEKLSFHSSHDDLTGLANRKTLEQRLSRVIESAHSEHSEHTLAIIDLDQFKIINDTCGYAAGDELLRQIARLLKAIVRKRDTLARIGGDEFAVLFEDCNLRGAQANIEAIRCAIEAYQYLWEGRTHRLSVSVGLVPINDSCDGAASALSMADTACYAAKDSGRNRIHAYQADDLKITAQHGQMRWATRINDALRENRFELSLQRITPIMEAATGDHYEFLIRMRDERGNIVMPGEFLPAAERYNLADQLDRWVIRHALNWLNSHPHILQRLHMCAINLSGQSMGNDDMLRFILEQIEYSSIPAHKLCFEVTETAAISDLMNATRFITLLKERGCRFALDDFGSGFSSLTYLKSLPVDFLKIDGTFVKGIANDSIDFAMVRSINDIGHVMGKKTIAEFVEDGKVLEILRSVGVDYAQGYEIGHPMPLSVFCAS